MNMIKKERSKTYNNYQSNNYPEAPKERPRGMSTNSHRQSGRELGVVEKLLSSYGFVQPADGSPSIFFHYSEFLDDIQSLQIGESLSFLVRTDRRSGKPVAVQLARASSVPPAASAAANGYTKEQVVLSYSTSGIIETPTRMPSDNGYRSSAAAAGRVSYEKAGEMFFLPYTSADVDVGQFPRPGDKVSFCIVQEKRSGELQVKQMRVTEAARKEEEAEPKENNNKGIRQGVISSLKEAFGFIERGDLVQEIFFHYSQFDGDVGKLMVGDDVQFEIQCRNGKEVATSVVSLPPGSVVFEDISDEPCPGAVIKVASRPKMNTSSVDEQLNGVIEFTKQDSTLSEIVYSERDMEANLNLKIGDQVTFLTCTDRRDHLQRAVNVQVVAVVARDGYDREQGVVCNIKEGFGFIKCCDRESNLFFHFSELIDQTNLPCPGDEAEFFVEQGDNGRQSASRIALLPKGSVKMETLSSCRYQGYVSKEPSGSSSKSPSRAARESEAGIIIFEDSDDEDEEVEVPFRSRDCRQREFPQIGDKVEFLISTNKQNGQLSAKEVSLVKRRSLPRQNGFICGMKENYGFIETDDHVNDIFFHFSESTCHVDDLSVGDEVEFSVIRKNGKHCAESVSKLKAGTIPSEDMLDGVFEGQVLRPVRTVDPDQPTYQGIIAMVVPRPVALEEKKSEPLSEGDALSAGEPDGQDESESDSAEEDQTREPELGEHLLFGITSMVDKKDPLHPGDKVTFQVGIDSQGQRRAVCVRCVRTVVRARVESIKGQFGFIAYETPDGKNLFFHMSEVDTSAGSVKPGDTVEFIVVKSHKNARQSAMKVKRVLAADSPKPGHLMRRKENTPVKATFIAIRKPVGPDGTIGFKPKEEKTQ